MGRKKSMSDPEMRQRNNYFPIKVLVIKPWLGWDEWINASIPAGEIGR